jgi:CsoR family transcriptional regulator, copper-sensing transcriptional repressor
VRGYTMTKQQYLARLRRIEGQVLGLQRQIEEDTYCIDVLQQIAAVNGALQNVAIGLLDEHVGHCVANAAAAGDQTRPATWSPKPPSHRQDHQDLTPAPPTTSATREERP